ncbi:hypothetical protein L914_03985 [Phytophthora nicotianae]|uniref:Uncharacterized protein n=2 Tax=Phytophthora nicotianae TaxID=4792 RepID=V9FMW5_PHYNI|nr:hypothetical protein F443_04149 [Phytophthora nicotianae P1569]ETM52394.1 hypothetical protein L914_03985 [Phytophthora nicotianae]
MWALNTSFDFIPLDNPLEATVRLDQAEIRSEVTDYLRYPWVLVSVLITRALFPERATDTLDIPKDDDIDASLLSENSMKPGAESGESDGRPMNHPDTSQPTSSNTISLERL